MKKDEQNPRDDGLGGEKRSSHTPDTTGEISPEKVLEESGLSLGTEPAEPARHLKLLSLDGSYGNRSLSALLILKQVLDTLQPGRDMKPCDYFDIIGGSGTGGILAIMLGRLRMSIGECIWAYQSLSDRTFRPRRQWSLPVVSDLFPSRFDSDALVQAVEEIVHRTGESHGAKLIDRRDSQCKVFVTAATQRAAGLQMHLLRTYRSAGEFQPDISIAQACHAALTASELVGPCPITAAGFSYADGLSSWNNPSFQVLAEGEQTWVGAQTHSTSLLSLGVGIPRRDALSSLPRSVARSIIEWSIEASMTAGRFEREHPGLASSGGHARLSIDDVCTEVGLYRRSAPTIEEMTETYLRRRGTVETIHAFVHHLRNPLPVTALGLPLEPELGPSHLPEPMSLPVEHDEELVPYSAIEGEKSERQATDLSEKPEKIPSSEKSEEPEDPLSTESVQWLKAHKDKFNEQSSSLFFLAAKERRIGLIKGLMKQGADINRQDQLRKTAVHLATEEGFGSVLQTLISYGADLDVRDKNGETALVKAVRKGDKLIVMQLLDGGADPDVADNIRWTPLAWACFYAKEALVGELAPRTVLCRYPTGMGSPLWRAKKLGNDSIASILEAEIAKRPTKPVEPPTLISLTPSPRDLFVGIPTCFAVVASINSCALRAVVGSGCNRSTISTRWLAHTGLDGLVDTRFSSSVRGLSVMRTTGRVHFFQFVLEGVSYSASALVLDCPNFDFLLGVDFLKMYNGSVDLSDNTLRLEGGMARGVDGVDGEESKATVNIVPMYGVDRVRDKGKGRA